MIDFFEDVNVGDVLILGEYTFNADEIVRFAEKFDPQPFHLSEEGASRTHFGRLCASGWHTASIFMKLWVAKLEETQKNAQATGVPIAKIGPSPGFEDLKWIKPVFVGDTLNYTRTVTGKTESRSRTEWGLIHSDMKARNQDGTLVFSFKANVFIERRPQKPS